MQRLLDLLSKFGLGQYGELFTVENIDIDVLSALTDEDLKELKMPIGDRRRMRRLVDEIQAAGAIAEPARPVADPLRTSQAVTAATSELRQVSVLFADIVGSTRLSEQIDVEDYRSILASFHDLCVEILGRHGGAPHNFLGDGVVACFGFPQAAEDDAVRASQSAIDIAERVAEIATPMATVLAVRVGVATGIVITERLSRASTESTVPVAGSVMNLAARLQAVAEPGTVLVDSNTRRHLSRGFEITFNGKCDLKGFTHAQDSWTITRAHPDQDAANDARSPGTAPLIGRRDELAFLKLRWQAVSERSGFVLISGEPGIGKTRLVNKFVEELGLSDDQVERMECHASASLRPLHPLIRLIEDACQLHQRMDVSERREKLHRWLTDVYGANAAVANTITQLVAPKAGGRIVEDGATTTERRLILFDVLLQFLKLFGDTTPQLLIIEDMQWIDPTTEELLVRWAELMAPEGILVLCTYRSDHSPRLLGEQRVTALSLSRLEEQEATQLVRSLPGSDSLLPWQLDEIVTRSDGVPIFLEEMAKSLLETNEDDAAQALDALSSRVALPTTLNGYLLARFDRVPSAHLLAPIGAAIGRRFDAKLLATVSGVPEHEEMPVLDHLVAAGLLTREGGGQSPVFAFKHSLVQDAVYQTMPRSRRMRVHLGIAEHLEQNEFVLVERHPELLARHLIGAEDFARACAAFQAAAISAQNALANVEAVAYLSGALDANDRTPVSSAKVDREIELRELLSASLEKTSWGSRALSENLHRLRELNRDRGHGDKLLIVMSGLAGVHLIDGKVSKAAAIGEEILALFDEQDMIAQCLGIRCRAFSRFMMSNFEPAIEAFREVHRLYREIDHEKMKKFYPADLSLVTGSMICWSHALMGDRIAFARELGATQQMIDGATDRWSQVYATMILAAACQSIGDVDSCLRLTSRSLPIAEDLKADYWRAWGGILRGWVNAMSDRGSNACAEIEREIQRYETTGSRQMLPYAKLLLAEARNALGDRDGARALADELTCSRVPAEIRYIDAALERLRHNLAADLSENGLRDRQRP